MKFIGDARWKAFIFKQNFFQKVCVTYLTYEGTGKTYASAFAMRELGFQRVLFLVHRVTLAKQAKKSFEKVFDDKVTMGLVGAGIYEYDSHTG